MRKERKEKKPIGRELQQMQPRIQSCCHLQFYPVEEQRHLSHEMSLAVIYCWISVLKNPIIPGCPDAPCHDDDFHVKGDL